MLEEADTAIAFDDLKLTRFGYQELRLIIARSKAGQYSISQARTYFCCPSLPSLLLHRAALHRDRDNVGYWTFAPVVTLTSQYYASMRQ